MPVYRQQPPKLAKLTKAATGLALGMALPLVLVACGGGGGGGGGPASADFAVAPLGEQSLSSSEVEEVVGRAVQASISRGVQSTIAITDRVGNVLAVYRMNNAALNTTITSGLAGANGNGLDGAAVPSELAAIAKAITGAYLSSTGNAFSTRTASQIVQEFFQPGERGQPSGPLYGVQFSQLPCSDLNVWLSQHPTIGPKRSPLGLSADPGGFPIYQQGRVVGGIGVIASVNAGSNGIYGLDRNILDNERDLEEEIAFAALSSTFRAPESIRANRITANGQTFQFSNSTPATAGVADLAATGSYIAVPGYKTLPTPGEGTAYGAAASGYAPVSSPAFAGLTAYTLVTDPADANSVRFAPTAGANLAQGEVQNMLAEALKIANRARAQIRNPLGSAAEVTISVVDTNGNILGLIRSSDAPVFGTDVSVQKARSALAFSSSEALADFSSANAGGQTAFANAMDTYFAQQTNVLNGSVAFSARAIGNSHRPYFPDGQEGTAAGPLSTPISTWSPFNLGFQLDFVAPKVLGTLGAPVRAVVGGDSFAPASAQTCVDDAVVPANRQNRYANGLQIFPGGFPIYKGNLLVGAIGVSGDGVDQDDMIGYLGVINGASQTASMMRPFPLALRTADELSRGGQALKYVQCPQTPFNDSNQQNVCPAP